MLIENPKIIKKIKELEYISDFENMKFNLYSIFTVILLSKEIFKTNTDISDFLRNFNLEFKQYVISSRTLMLSRVLREIDRADEQKIKFYTNTLFSLTEPNFTSEKSIETTVSIGKKKKSDTYVDSILNKYSRRKG